MLCQDVSFGLLLSEGLYSGVGRGSVLKSGNQGSCSAGPYTIRLMCFRAQLVPPVKLAGFRFTFESYLRVPDQSRTWICG